MRSPASAFVEAFYRALAEPGTVGVELRAHRRLAREPDLDPDRRRKAVCDEGRLECDDGPLVLERGLDLVCDADQVLHAPQRSRVAVPFRLRCAARRSSGNRERRTRP